MGFTMIYDDKPLISVDPKQDSSVIYEHFTRPHLRADAQGGDQSLASFLGAFAQQ